MLEQEGGRRIAKVGPGLDAQRLHLARGDRTDAVKLGHGQRRRNGPARQQGREVDPTEGDQMPTTFYQSCQS